MNKQGVLGKQQDIVEITVARLGVSTVAQGRHDKTIKKKE